MQNKISKWTGATNGKHQLPMLKQRTVEMKMSTLCSIPALLEAMTSARFYNKNIQLFSVFFSSSQSTPESWAQNSHDNIVNGQNQLMASIQLRALIDSILTDISRDMREQADVVETEFARRIAEMSDAMQKMIQNNREVDRYPSLFSKKKIELHLSLFRH